VTQVWTRRVQDARGKRKSGTTYLVDGVWPRGVAKTELALDGWLRDVAPSTDLRQWFGHDPQRWAEFQLRYRRELDDNPQATEPLLQAARRGRLVLLYAARDTEHNQAVVLKQWVEEHA
jgi:uncharacterized protein YeaO (DUF488 family)